MRLGKVFVDSVIVGERHRPLNAEALPRLRDSMKEIGLQQPIIVHLDSADAAHLVAGRHRLEAARLLGWEEIDASFIDGDEIDRELAEIAENLHRTGLTKDERDRHIVRYAELIEAREKRERETSVARTDCPTNDLRSDGRRKGPQHETGIAAKVAEQTGLSQRTVRRALQKATDPEADRQRKEAEQRRREQDRVVRVVASEEYAEWLLRRVDPGELPTLISWIEASPPRELIAALRRLSDDQPVMDARYGDPEMPEFLRRTDRGAMSRDA